MNPTLIVLAAGMGSRYGGLKQLDAIGPSGETIIDYSIFDAIRAGFGKVVFVIRRSIEQEFKEVFGGKFGDHVEVAYALQEIDMVPAGISYDAARQKPWGTGHAVLVTRPYVHTPFAVINADDFYGASSFQLMADYLKTLTADATTHCMVGFRLENTLSDFGSVSRGVCEVDEQDQLIGVTERTRIERKGGRIYYQEDGQDVELTGDEVASMNMFGFAPSMYAHCDAFFREFIEVNQQHLKAEFYIPTVVNRMLQEGLGTMKVLYSQEKWFGVTYQEDKAAVQQNISDLVEQGVYPSPLWSAST